MAAYVEDTIAALATPPGTGAIAVLRLSGRDACDVAARILRRRNGEHALSFTTSDSHRARLARLVTPETGAPIDEVLVIAMHAPRSFTGEDVVEIHCHGGPLVADLALRAAFRAGARAALAGEFSERAFQNGRLDLCQAEAVADLIAARSEAGVAAAWRQLGGDLSQRVLEERDRLLDARALVEAHLDFPEDDLPPGVEADLVRTIGESIERLQALAATFARGRLARDGVRVVLVGKPNVGKSSLLNALLGRERALVSAEPGTTRDYLEEPLALGSLGALLCDTAGIREGETAIERAGVERSRERIERADVLVVVLDGARPLDREDAEVLARCGERPLVAARNKCDLAPVWSDSDVGVCGGRGRDVVAVSALRRVGLERLCAAIVAAVPAPGPSEDGVQVMRARHHVALVEACGRLEVAATLLAQRGELELVAAELQAGCTSLEGLVGQSSSEDILDRIFRQFCVGK